MAFDAAPVALGALMFGERGEEAGGGPALLVGTLGEAGPSLPDRGQAQSPPPRRRICANIGACALESFMILGFDDSEIAC